MDNLLHPGVSEILHVDSYTPVPLALHRHTTSLTLDLYVFFSTISFSGLFVIFGYR